MIYEKTIIVVTLTTGDNAFNHGITNLNNIISANGFALRGQSTRMVIPYSSNNAGGWSIGIYEFNDTKGYVVTGTGYTGQYELSNCYVTLQYTKSS